jgi:RNA polymerase sigma factor (sigma-70 family)
MYNAQGTLDRKEAIERYSPLVRRLANQLIARLPANVEIDDLIQAGMIGLFDSLSRYEAGMGAQFETFAMQRVRGAMLDELRGSDWLPRSVRKNQRTIETAIHALEQRLKRPPSEPEIAEELVSMCKTGESVYAQSTRALKEAEDQAARERGDTPEMPRNAPPAPVPGSDGPRVIGVLGSKPVTESES